MGTKISVPHNVTQSYRKKSLPIQKSIEESLSNPRTSSSTLAPSFMCFNPLKDDASDRMTSNHFALNALFEGNTLPIIQKHVDFSSTTTKVLDIGCGPGSWVMDMATQYPNAQFVGIDQYPFFPGNIRPANVSFRQADVLLGLPFDSNSFDFVQLRLFSLTFNRSQWIEALNEVLRLLKPGGYVQLLEPRLMEEGDALITEYTQRIKSVLECNDVDSELYDHLSLMLENSQITPKESLEKTVPLQNHVLSGEFMYIIEINVQSFKQFITKTNGIQSDDEFNQFKADYLKSKKQTELVFKAVAGQKPM
ncbi:unnamed protein product [Rhizopus stolonifer]